MFRKDGRPSYAYLVEYERSVDHGPWETGGMAFRSSDPVLTLRRITHVARGDLIRHFGTTDVRVRSVRVLLPEPVCPSRSRSKA